MDDNETRKQRIALAIDTLKRYIIDLIANGKMTLSPQTLEYIFNLIKEFINALGL